MFRRVRAGVRARKGYVAWLVAALALVVLLPTAGAQAPRAGRDAAAQKLEAIRALMEKGQALYVAGDYAGAAKVFEAGYASYPYSAFLFNAGVCYQKLKDVDKALDRFREYVRVDPSAPDVDKVKQRIAGLEAAKGVVAPPPVATDGGADGAVEGGATDGGAVQPPTAPGPVDTSDDQNAMKSLVLIETEPAGAPLEIYARTDDGAKPFHLGGANPGWRQVAATTSPANLTLAVGRYHIVVQKFRDFNPSETDIDVSPGHVHLFKANLSQGAFMAFLRVSANVKGAHVYLDDKDKKRPEWGVTPYGELVSGGKHTILVEAPGFEPLFRPVELAHGEQKELNVELVRVGYGLLALDSNAPEIKVQIDGEPMGVWRSGEPPLRVKASANGPHQLRVSSDGRKTYTGMITVPRGQIMPLHANMIPKYPRGTAWTQAVIGAAFVGAAIYFGTESNRIHDQLQADRAAGVLEEDDSRITKGRWYSIGADAGFAIGGVLGIVATYNFIKDPLPESSTTAGKPKEFDDPKSGRPTALRWHAGPTRRRLVRRAPPQRPLHVAPALGANGGVLGFGGTF